MKPPTTEEVKQFAREMQISEALARQLIEIARISDKPRPDGTIVTI